MKIHNFGVTGMNPYKKQMAKTNAQMQKAQLGSDKIEISNTAKELQQNSSVIVDRQKKLEAIQKQIETGTYKVDPEKVAKSMVDFFSKKNDQ
ncbi:hypothetical protein GCM10008967_06760 [Bacillus carboniphilus]|uniref:Negative regulator of flagellin synthesis n=1 Tax=Bacillus carboniphilus TaxID=86663 RepID=A0ABN0VW50_9BACI